MEDRTIKQIISELSKPIDSVKWKIQVANERYAICVPYIDSRDVQIRLDEVCTWESRHKDIGGRIYCEIGIWIGERCYWRDDAGMAGSIEKDKSEASDSFKRAGVMWGIGRFLYDMEPHIFGKTVKNGKSYVPSVSVNGRQEMLRTGSQISDYINKHRGGKSKLELVLIEELKGINNTADLSDFYKNQLQPVLSKRKASLNG